MTPNPSTQPRIFRPPANGEHFHVDGRNYWIGEILGQGAFGAVYACNDEWGNELVAKVLLPRNRSYEEIQQHCLRERERLLELRHPNITFLRECCEYRDTFYLILERCSFTLTPIITLPNLVSDLWIPWVARDVLQGLDYIHSKGYVHKDIHPENVFASLAQDKMYPTTPPVWSFKIADLGIAGLEAELHPNEYWAQWMVPPEVIDSDQFGAIEKTVDVYHTGLLLLALMLNRVPSFTREEIIAGTPRQLAEQSSSKFAPAVSVALRRHPAMRYQTAIDFWRAISAAIK